MIKGVGVDIVHIKRVSERLAEKVLVGDEEYRNAEHFAGLWAAKEAVLKALGCGISCVSFKDVEVVYNNLGAPGVQLSANGEKRLKTFGASSIYLSISHEREYAVAFAVIE